MHPGNPKEKRYRTGGRLLGNEYGYVLPVGLVFLAVLGIMGTTAVFFTTTDIQIGTNYRVNEQAFYAAEAGIEEARERLRSGSSNPITDGHPTSSQWRVYIGTIPHAQKKGYDSSNAMHVRTACLYTGTDMVYTVKIAHKLNSLNNVVYLGDTDGDGVFEENTVAVGTNVYIVTSEGTAGGAVKEIQIQVAAMPPITTPAALYVEAPTTVQGTATDIVGDDSCGSNDLPGISTALAMSTITVNGGPNIAGTPVSIEENATNLSIDQVVAAYQNSADFSYTVNADTQTGTAVPGPGDGWGTPTPGATLENPSSCTESNIVYYNTGGTFITLSGGVTGCGVLLVNGDLNISGGFSWYGIVVVNGSVTFTGGGNKNITGAVLAGGSANGDLIGGNANIIYCSAAVNNQTVNMPLRVFTWRDKSL